MTTPPEAPTPTAPAAPPSTPDKGFPEATPLAEMTSDQQVAYWKHQARKHEERANARSDYDDLKAKAAEADRLRQERETEAEKAIREAREQARQEARRESAPLVVSAEFRAAAAGRIESERLAALTEDIDLGRYLKPDGSVDVEKVAAKVAAWAPAGSPLHAAPQWPSMGQGYRPAPVTTGREAGRAEAQRRFGSKDKT